MSLDFARDGEAERLLEELAARVAATPALAAEWAAAWRAWPDAGADPRAALRFREWFLMERNSPALGGPPAAAWSPSETGEEGEDPWARLLGSFYGIFRAAGETEGGARLEDLWSGRTVRLADGAGLPEGALVFGRVLPEGEGDHALLPGWRVAAGDALAEALAADLAAARVTAPRARLSQAEIERLWAEGRAEAPAAPDFAALLRELEGLLAGAPDWDADRALETLETEGPEALLERLAFETSVPLDPVRAWLLALRAAAQAEAAPPEGAAAAEAEPAAACDPDLTAAALEAFDRERAAGADFRSAWTHLVEALQVDGAEPEEVAPWRAAGGAREIGPPALPGLGFWVDAWAWERAQTGTAPGEPELAAARAFARFVEGLREEPADAAEVGSAELWAYFAGSPDAEALERRRAQLLPFLRWLRDEQGANLPLEEAESADSPRWKRLATSVAVNARLRPARAAGLQTVRLGRTAPLRVRTEDAEEAAVLGLPEEAAALARPGDALMGRWEAGSFRVAGWFPADFAPESGGAARED